MAEIMTERIAEDLTNDGLTMVSSAIEYPSVSGTTAAAKRINMFYDYQAKSLLRYIKNGYFPLPLRNAHRHSAKA